MADASHRLKLWYRTGLFFRCSFRNASGCNFELDLALLNFLYDFKCPDAQTILQKEGVARMFYCRLRARHAMADCAAHQPHPWQGATHEGISLWLTVTYDSKSCVSSQAITLPSRTRRSVQQRRANKKLARKAAAKKRTERRAYTREKAV